MLQAVANVAPRGVYVCGNTTTSSGLTVTLNREGGSGNYSLEAGALVLADQGVCSLGVPHVAVSTGILATREISFFFCKFKDGPF